MAPLLGSEDSRDHSGSEHFQVEVVKQSPLSNHKQDLSRDTIAPRAMNIPDAAEASKLGRSSKPISNWYQHICTYDSCPERWSEFDNVDADEADLKIRTTDVPIIHRHKYQKKHWVTQSITIQDPSMKKVLADVLKDYQDLDLEIENWTFKPPFMPLVHRWDELNEYQDQATDPVVKNAASALLTFLKPVLDSSVVSLAKTRATGKVKFEDVWQIFPPRSLVQTKFYGVDTICRVVKYKEREGNRREGIIGAWIIDMEYIDWNGESSGYATTTVSILAFEGYCRVIALPVFPISFHNDEAGIRESMIERGREFQRLRGFRFMVSSGTKVTLETKHPTYQPVAGKVCVDAYAYYRSCNIVKPKLRSLYEEDAHANIDTAEETEISDTAYESKFTAALPEVNSTSVGPAERPEDLRPLSEEHLLLTTPWLKGFDLKSKDWCELRIDELKDMTWNDEAFEKLVLPNGEKELAWSFVENKSLSRDSFDDFIPDKGRGLIILMFGPPGVGKTFTAEAVAERSRVPLYSMSAGDLGTKPADVEKALERALELCRMWDAMLLLDEADVFLGTRTNESLARNELVSIFLRKLEYYAGTLFLTTNRISSIDHAFQSRVDLFLRYDDLTPEARRRVWENFIDRAGREKFENMDGSLEKLSQLSLNGREIKNLIKSAQLLSLKSGGKVPMDRLYMLANKRVQALEVLDSVEG
ncbi:P-loop containing nucleoside triphosphate hydrolase protein [Whalleya microplaca]|nr:P-loop containing nucleoside triphosphate hydrolase protein [Whalleya microplaca]